MKILNNVKPKTRFVSKIAGKNIKVVRVQQALDPRNSKVLVVDLERQGRKLVENFDTYRVVLADSIRRRYNV